MLLNGHSASVGLVWTRGPAFLTSSQAVLAPLVPRVLDGKFTAAPLCPGLLHHRLACGCCHGRRGTRRHNVLSDDPEARSPARGSPGPSEGATGLSLPEPPGRSRARLRPAPRSTALPGSRPLHLHSGPLAVLGLPSDPPGEAALLRTHVVSGGHLDDQGRPPISRPLAVSPSVK